MKPRYLLFILFCFVSLIAEAQLPAAIPYRKGTKWGLCDSTKRMLVQPVYRSVAYLDRQQLSEKAPADLFFLVQDSLMKCGVVNGKGEWIVPMGFTQIEQQQEHFFIVRKDELFGTFALDGKALLPVRYNSHYQLTDAIVQIDSAGFLGLIDSSGSLLLPCRYAGFQRHYPTRLIEVSTDKKQRDTPSGYFDPLTRRMIIEPIYDAVYNDGGFFFLSKNKRYGVADSTGRMVLPFAKGRVYSEYHTDSLFWRVFKSPLPPHHKRYRLEGPGGKAWATEALRKPQNYPLDLREERFQLAEHDKKWGLYDIIAGKWLLPIGYDSILLLPHSAMPIIFMRDHKTGIANDEGKIILPIDQWPLDGDGEFIDPVFLGKKGGLYGTIDSAGKTVIPFRFETLRYDGNNHLFVTRIHDTDRIVLANGETGDVFHPQQLRYSRAIGIADGTGSTNERINNLSYDGKTLLFPKGTYRSLALAGNNCWLTEAQNGLRGLLDAKGNVLLPDTFPEVVSMLRVNGNSEQTRFWECIIFHSVSGYRLYQLKQQKLSAPFFYLSTATTSNDFGTRSYPTGDYHSSWGKLNGYIRGDGTEIIPTEYREIENVTASWRNIRLAYRVPPGNGDWCDVDVYSNDTLTDHLRDSFCWVHVLSITEHLYAIQNQFHQTGVMGKDGKKILPMKYGSISPLKIGGKMYLDVRLNAVGAMQHQLFDLNGKLLLSGKSFTQLQYTTHNMNLLLVSADSCFFLIDSTGKMQGRMVADQVSSLNQRYIRFSRKGKSGVMDNAGNVLVPAEYDGLSIASVQDATSPYLIVTRGKQSGLIDLRKGQVLRPLSDGAFNLFSGTLFYYYDYSPRMGYFSASGIQYWED